MTTRPCISADDLAAFIDGVLPPADRDRVVEHLADCPRCQATYEDVVGLMGEPEEAEEAEEDVEKPLVSEVPKSAYTPLPLPMRTTPQPRIWMQLAAALGALTLGAALWWSSTARERTFDDGTLLASLSAPEMRDDTISALHDLGVGGRLRSANNPTSKISESVELGAILAQVKLQQQLGIKPEQSLDVLQSDIESLRSGHRPYVRLGQWLTYSYVACSTGNLKALNDPDYRRFSLEAAERVGSVHLRTPQDRETLRRFAQPWTSPPDEEHCDLLADVYDQYTRPVEEH